MNPRFLLDDLKVSSLNNLNDGFNPLLIKILGLRINTPKQNNDSINEGINNLSNWGKIILKYHYINQDYNRYSISHKMYEILNKIVNDTETIHYYSKIEKLFDECSNICVFYMNLYKMKYKKILDESGFKKYLKTLKYYEGVNEYVNKLLLLDENICNIFKDKYKALDEKEVICDFNHYEKNSQILKKLDTIRRRDGWSSQSITIDFIDSYRYNNQHILLLLKDIEHKLKEYDTTIEDFNKAEQYNFFNKINGLKEYQIILSEHQVNNDISQLYIDYQTNVKCKKYKIECKKLKDKDMKLINAISIESYEKVKEIVPKLKKWKEDCIKHVHDIESEHTNSEQSTHVKYLKYKKKYIELKSKLNNKLGY